MPTARGVVAMQEVPEDRRRMPAPGAYEWCGVADSVDGNGDDEKRLREQDWISFNQQQ